MHVRSLAAACSRWVLRLTALLVLTALVGALVTVQPAAPTYAIGPVDQQQTTQNSYATVNASLGFAQTFTAGVTGDLDQIDLGIGKSVAASTFTIEIRDTLAGAPGPTVLSTLTVATTTLPFFLGGPAPIASFPISPPVPIVAGTQYTIAVRAGTSDTMVAGISTTDVYAGGLEYIESPPGNFLLTPFDVVFRTYVTPPTATPTSTSTPTPTATSTSTSTPTATSTSTPTATSTPTSTPTATSTVTSTATATVSATATPTVTATPIVTATPTATATPTVTSTTTAAATAGSAAQAVNDPNNDDEKPKETNEQKQDRQHTNNGNRDDIHTEGYVVAVDMAADGQTLLVTIALGPGGQERLVVQVPCSNGSCPDVQVGDELSADGYQNGVGDPNTYFVASDGISIWRNGHKP